VNLIDLLEIKEIDPESLENLPYGLGRCCLSITESQEEVGHRDFVQDVGQIPFEDDVEALQPEEAILLPGQRVAFHISLFSWAS
jgi:hypothetical protein